MENIKKITSRDETVTTLIKLANGIRIVTGVILILLVVISIFIIANTIKLTVHARRKEISIMKYVGATNGFIRWPFIVEGMIIGIIASAISIVIVGGAYSFLAEQLVNSQFMQVINMSLISFADMFNSIIFVYMLLGIGIGALGSVISMRKYLKV
jgi:cell division transport system permease protein